MLSSQTGVRRIWHGWATEHDADAYETLLLTDVVPGILDRRIAGLRSLDVVRRHDATARQMEFATIMDFDDLAAVRRFAGGDGHSSVVPPAARRLLARYDASSRHYELRARAIPD